MINSLLDRPPQEVQLAAAPLIRVLCAVRFSPVMKIVAPDGTGIADFQERIRFRYPTLSYEQEHSFQFEVTEQGAPLAPLLISQPIWRFFDKTKSWRVSLTRETLGLETQTAYTDRAEFMERLVELCSALQAVYEPSQCLRLGVRYVNALTADRLDRLADFVTSPFLAFGYPPFAKQLTFSHQTAEFSIPEGRLVAHFGVLGAGQVHDPQVMDASDERRYFLDLDAIASEPLDFSAHEIEIMARGLAKRIYTVFREAVTPALLESCNAS